MFSKEDQLLWRFYRSHLCKSREFDFEVLTKETFEAVNGISYDDWKVRGEKSDSEIYFDNREDAKDFLSKHYQDLIAPSDAREVLYGK